MGVLIENVTMRDRLVATLNHTEPDRIPIDFGGSPVTGIHASCVAALRDYYGLEKRPVRVHEPFQMLGLVDDDLQDAMGIDVARGLSTKLHVRVSGRGLEKLAVQWTGSAGPREFQHHNRCQWRHPDLPGGRHDGPAQRAHAEAAATSSIALSARSHSTRRS